MRTSVFDSYPLAASTLSTDLALASTPMAIDRNPPTGFFQAPEALDTVWAGEKDTVTPPAQAESLKQKLGQQVDRPLSDRVGVAVTGVTHAARGLVTVLQLAREANTNEDRVSRA